MTTDRTQPARPSAAIDRSAAPAQPRDESGAFAALLDAHAAPCRDERAADQRAPRTDRAGRRADAQQADGRDGRDGMQHAADRCDGVQQVSDGRDGAQQAADGGLDRRDVPQRPTAGLPGDSAWGAGRPAPQAGELSLGGIRPTMPVQPGTDPAAVQTGEAGSGAPAPAEVLPPAIAAVVAKAAPAPAPAPTAAPAGPAPATVADATPAPAQGAAATGDTAQTPLPDAPTDSRTAPDVPARAAQTPAWHEAAVAQPAPAEAQASAPAPAKPKPTAAPEAPAPATAAPATSSPVNPAAAAPAGAPLGGAAAPQRTVPLHRAPAAVATLLHVAADRGITRARMALRPAELGGVEIRLQATSAGVAAQVVADSPEAARLLAQAGDDLRRALEARDVTLLSLEVSTTSDQQQQSARGEWSDGDRADSGFPGPDPSTGDAAGDAEPAPTTQSVIELPGGLLVDVLA